MERVLHFDDEMKSFAWALASCGLVLPLAVLACTTDDDTQAATPASAPAGAEAEGDCPRSSDIKVGEPCNVAREARCDFGRSMWPPECTPAYEARAMCVCADATDGGPRVWYCDGTFAIHCTTDAGPPLTETNPHR